MSARLKGMKIRAELDPPRAATGGFPYPGRTCAEWRVADDYRTKPRTVAKAPPDPRNTLPKEMSPKQREKDATNGSAMLRDAILALVA